MDAMSTPSVLFLCFVWMCCLCLMWCRFGTLPCGFGVERHEEEEEEGEFEPGRRSKPISLATKVGVFAAPGDSEDKSFKFLALALVHPPLVLICMFFWVLETNKLVRWSKVSSFYIIKLKKKIQPYGSR